MVRIMVALLMYAGVFSARAQNQNDTLLVCAHRGGFYNLLPENSLSAIRYTNDNCRLKPVVIEIDVRRSKDGTLYILHDETVDRTTNGKGNIITLTDTYIKALKLKTSTGILTNESVPAFREVLAYAKNNGVVLMLDVKDDIWRDVISVVNEYGMADKCIALTFNPDVSAKVYALSKIIHISVLAKDESSWGAVRKLNIPDDNLIAYVTSTTDASLVSAIYHRKIKIMADASESMRNNAMLYDRDFYHAVIDHTKLSILITDFPVDVSKLLRGK